MAAERHDDIIETVDPVMLEAMAWFAGTHGDGTRVAQWRAKSPEHDQAYEMVEVFQKAARNMPKPAEIVPFRKQETVSRRALLGGGGGIAASLAGFIVARAQL